MISRAERGLQPQMGLDALTRVGHVLGPALPLGFCPHDHRCVWEAIEMREPPPTPLEALRQRLLNPSGDDEDD